MTAPASDPLAIAREYFRRLDAGSPELADLFSDDAVIYFPKYGFGAARQTMQETGAKLGEVIASIEHDLAASLFLQDGNRVVVEGVSRGVLRNGSSWAPGETPTGRFCNVFEFRDGKIARLAVYLDPDYASTHDAGFLWGREGRSW